MCSFVLFLFAYVSECAFVSLVRSIYMYLKRNLEDDEKYSLKG